MSSIQLSDFTIDYSAKCDASEVLRKYGVCIVRGVVSADECARRVESLYGELNALFPELDRAGYEWTSRNTPLGPRPGLYQSMVSNLPTVWETRLDERVRGVFRDTYATLRARPDLTRLTVALDGVNVRPRREPYHRGAEGDWPHLDQTRDAPKIGVAHDVTETCVQGQVVLNDSSSCFVASPRSHLVHDALLTEIESSSKGSKNWHPFARGDRASARSIVESVGGVWQMPIRAPRGSLILWFSSTVHSAKLHDPIVQVPRDPPPFFDWRVVVYVCYRPRDEMSVAERRRLARAVAENRVTNHWSARLFPKTWRFYDETKHSPSVRRYAKNPQLVYDTFPITKELRARIAEVIE